MSHATNDIVHILLYSEHCLLTSTDITSANLSDIHNEICLLLYCSSYITPSPITLSYIDRCQLLEEEYVFHQLGLDT